MSLPNECFFRAVSGGLSDFVVSSAITGYFTPAQCTSPAIVNGRSYVWRAESDDLSQHELFEGVYTAAGTTIARTTIRQSSNGGAKVNFSAAPRVRLVGVTQSEGSGKLVLDTDPRFRRDGTSGVNLRALFGDGEEALRVEAAATGPGADDPARIEVDADLRIPVFYPPAGVNSAIGFADGGSGNIATFNFGLSFDVEYSFPDGGGDVICSGNPANLGDTTVAGDLFVNQGTNTDGTAAIRVVSEWDGATDFRGLFLDITNTASDPASRVIKVDVDGGEVFSVDADGQLIAANHIVSGGDYRVGADGVFVWTTRSILASPADGQFLLHNADEDDFDRLMWGGTTSSFPALKRNGAALQVRLADDSGFAGLQLGTASSSLQVGTHSALGSETVTGFITIKDSGGTDRKIAVVS